MVQKYTFWLLFGKICLTFGAVFKNILFKKHRNRNTLYQKKSVIPHLTPVFDCILYIQNSLLALHLKSLMYTKKTVFNDVFKDFLCKNLDYDPIFNKKVKICDLRLQIPPHSTNI